MTAASMCFTRAFKTEILFDISRFIALTLWARCVRNCNNSVIYFFCVCALLQTREIVVGFSEIPHFKQSNKGRSVILKLVMFH